MRFLLMDCFYIPVLAEFSIRFWTYSLPFISYGTCCWFKVLVFPHLKGVPSGSAVDVFSEGGVFLGRVELPVVLELRPEPVCRGGRLVGITKGEFDVPYVVAFELEGGRD